MLISSIQLPIKQSSFNLFSLYLAKNYFTNPASNKQLNKIFVLFRTNSPWDESSGDETSVHQNQTNNPKYITNDSIITRNYTHIVLITCVFIHSYDCTAVSFR